LSRSPTLGHRTARLLPRLLGGRTSGPVFLAARHAATTGRRVPARADVDPTTGRGRLSLRYDPHAIGWTLHQLRHSALRHLAAAGRTAPELQAKSRHKHLATLGPWTVPGLVDTGIGCPVNRESYNGFDTP